MKTTPLPGSHAGLVSVFLACPALLLGQATSSSTREPENVQVMDQFVVKGIRDSLRNSAEEQRAANNLKDVISADAVGKLPDSNIAEAISRVPGLYISADQGEGRYVSIRGIDPTLNNVTFNGQTIAVSDVEGRSGRAAPLDVLSAASLSKIEVVKTVTPDMDGQSIGGTINIKSPSALDHRGTRIYGVAEYGYNEYVEDRGDIYTGELNFSRRLNENWGLFLGLNHSQRDYLTFMVGSREGWIQSTNYLSTRGVTNEFGPALIPNRLKWIAYDGAKKRSGGTLNLEFKNASSQFWVRGYFTEQIETILRPELEVRLRNITDSRDIRLTSATSGYGIRANFSHFTLSRRTERPVQQIVVGGEHTLADKWKLSGNVNFTKANEKVPYQNYADAETRIASNNTGAPGRASNPQNAIFTWDVSGFFPVIEPVMGRNAAGQPNWPNPNASGFGDPAFHMFYRNRLESSIVDETTYTFDFNLQRDLRIGTRPGFLKAGGKYLQRDKSVDDTSDRWIWSGANAPAFFLNEPGYFSSFASRFGDFAIGPDSYRRIVTGYPNPQAYTAHLAANRSRYTYDLESSVGNSYEDDYDLTEKVYAGYAMGSFNVLPALNLSAGVRLEETRTRLTGQRVVDAADSVLLGTEKVGPLNVSYTNWLPNAQLRWAIADAFVFRAAYSATLGRPDYPDMSPIGNFQQDPAVGVPNVFVGSLTEGNPDLQPYEAQNFDVSLSYYLPKNAGVISVGGFRKDIDNAIYPFVFDAVRDGLQKTGLTYTRLPNGNIRYLDDEYERLTVTTFSNAKRGKVSGLELSYQHDLAFLPDPLRGLGFAANASFIDSSVKIFQRPQETFPFFRQADEIYNVQLYYQRGGFEARVGWHYQSPAFLQPGPDTFRDLYEDENEQIDLRVSYQFTRHLGAYVSVKNLENEPKRTYFNNPRLLGFGSAEDNMGYHVFGATYHVGIRWNFDR